MTFYSAHLYYDVQIPDNRATSKTLSRTTLLKLALLTWHFDASGEPSEGLSRFLRQPRDSAVWDAGYSGYRRIENDNMPLGEFKMSHDFLLCPHLH